MKAMVTTRYGSPDVLRLEELPRPTPGDHDVLVQVHAAGVNPADWHILRADPFLVRLAFGLRRPRHRILGADVAGRVVEVGSGVEGLRPGDEVYGDLSGDGFGGFAQFVLAREQALALKPPGISFEQAAAVPLAAVTALQGMRDHGKIQPGQQVLVNGASGGVGTFAVQLARHFGAQVTAVCSTRNVGLVRSLGAERVIDYTREDFTKNGQRYDLIFAAHGDSSILGYRRALRPGGRYINAGGSSSQMYQALLLGPLLSLAGNRKLGSFVSKPHREDLQLLGQLLQDGKLRPVIDRRYPLDDVPEALRYLEQGHARGKVVITVENGADAS